jgi:hypothetical protein
MNIHRNNIRIYCITTSTQRTDICLAFLSARAFVAPNVKAVATRLVHTRESYGLCVRVCVCACACVHARVCQWCDQVQLRWIGRTGQTRKTFSYTVLGQVNGNYIHICVYIYMCVYMCVCVWVCMSTGYSQILVLQVISRVTYIKTQLINLILFGNKYVYCGPEIHIPLKTSLYISLQ